MLQVMNATTMTLNSTASVSSVASLAPAATVATAANITLNNVSAALSVGGDATWIQTFIYSHTGLSMGIADVLSAIVILIAFIVLSRLAKLFVTKVAPHLVAKTSSTLDDEILNAIKGPVQVLILMAGVFFACKTLDHLSLSMISDIDKITQIALILVIAYFVANLIGAICRWYLHDIAPRTESDLDDQLIPFLNKVLEATVYIIALTMIVGQFIEITPLLASMGVAGVAVAFAAKESLGNIFGAITIVTDRPYKIGDRLMLKGIGQGDVTAVGLRSTRVRTTDNRIVVIPNQVIAKNKVINISKPDEKVRLTLKVSVSYKSDVDRACKLLEEIAAGLEYVSKELPPRAYVSSLADSSIDISLLVWLDSFNDDLKVPDLVYRRTLDAFKKEGIEIPFPVVTIKPRRG
jgi:MscS family membrane protein